MSAKYASVSLTSALRHSKPKCTWDETPVARTKQLCRRFTEKELAEMDLQEYVASSGSEDGRGGGDDDDDDHVGQAGCYELSLPACFANQTSGDAQKNKAKPKALPVEEYRKLLLQGVTEDDDPPSDEDNPTVSRSRKDPKGDGGAQRRPPKASLDKLHEYVRQTAQTNDISDDDLEDKPPALEKRKTKRKTKKPLLLVGAEPDQPIASKMGTSKPGRGSTTSASLEEDNHSSGDDKANLELLMMDTSGRSERHFDLRKEGKKRGKKAPKKKKAAEEQQKPSFQVDLNDDRFSKLLTNHEFALDPTDPHYKNTPTNVLISSERRSKRKRDQEI